jgi:hypothetical protein
MASKEREIVWHKKKGKFISPALTKGHHVKGEGDAAQVIPGRQRFTKTLADKIKAAVQHSSNQLS